MASMAQTVAELRRAAFQPKFAIVTSVVGDGTVMVQYAGSDPIPAYLTDATAATVAVGRTVTLHLIGGTLQVAATIATPLGADLVPNGNFSLPGDGMAPYGWTVQSPTGTDNWQLLSSYAAAPPGHSSAGALNIYSMSGLSIQMGSGSFTVDPGASYQLSAMVSADATVTTGQFAPYLSCIPADPNAAPETLTSGPLSPGITTAWQAYTETFTLPSDAVTASVNLVFYADSSSYGAINIAAVSLQQT